MKAIQKNKTITSLELLKKINELREKEYLEKAKAGTLTEAERKRGKAVKLKHKSFLNVIRDEFENEITGQNILLSEDLESSNEKTGVQNILETSQQKLLPITNVKIYVSKYKDKSGKENEMFVLALNQAKQVLMRESKYVRKAVIGYIDYLENQNRQLEELTRLQARELAKATRNIETLNIKALLYYGKVSKPKQKFHYIHYTNLARDIAGIPKGLKRDELTQGQLGILQQVELIMSAVINECINEQIPFTLIYQEVRERTETKAKVLLKALQKIESVDNGPVWSLEYSENKGENSYEQ
jgi:hypothetical protein cdivTM_25069